jgi:hypothetical protein
MSQSSLNYQFFIFYLDYWQARRGLPEAAAGGLFRPVGIKKKGWEY